MHREITTEEYKSVYKSISEDGFCIVKDYLTQSFTSELASIVENAYQKHLKTGKNYQGVPERDKYDKIVYNAYNLDIRFIKLLSSEPVMNIGKFFLNDEHYRFLDSDKPNFTLNYQSVMYLL